MGNWSEAKDTAERLRKEAESLPTEREKRRYHHLMGEIFLARNETAPAIKELQNAQSMLPAPGISWSRASLKHVPIWFSLACAYLVAGDENGATEWFERITESTTEHIWWPIPYVRSFYFLGKIHENRGEMEKAREYYRRFYEYWKDGDMDRERVEEAKSKLGIT
jgi:tetratricopeptide (TPR) repeat protein